ncbi:MAG: membrane protein [Thermodesulfobacteriota bacterium]|nr:MAG: membrane protein [Thermodesulfobacteriota bacterium]
MSTGRERLILFLHLAVLIFLGLLVYSNTFHSPFLFDDIGHILENPSIRDLGNFLNFSGTRYFSFLSFALNYAVGGYDTFGYHLVNIILHVSNAVLLYLIVLNLFKTPVLEGDEDRRFASDVAFTAALLFVVHPVETQAVTYITQRFATMAAFFYLLSVFLYLKSRLLSRTDNKGRYWLFYVLSFVFALAAQKTKEISFTLPAIIVLVEFVFFSNGERVFKRLARLVPFVLLFAVIPLELFLPGIVHSGAAAPIAEKIRLLQLQDMATLSRSDYLLTQFRVIVTYMRLIVFPVNLNLDYDYPVYRSFFNPAVFISFLFVAGVFLSGVYLLVKGLRHRSALYLTISFGIIWFFVTLSVESSIIPIKDVIFEHRLYLPSAGAFLAISSLYFLLVKKVFKGSKRPYAMAPVFIVIIVLAFAAHGRNRVWSSGMALWGDVVKKSPNKARGYGNLGRALLDSGKIDEAEKNLLKAVSLDKGSFDAYNNLGIVMLNRERYFDAIRYFKRSVEINPDYDKAFTNMGAAFVSLERPREAIDALQRALEINPGIAEAHNNLGLALVMAGMVDSAIEEYNTALKMRPGAAVIYNNLGKALMTAGRYNEAVRAFEKAVTINPSEEEYAQNLSGARRLTGVKVR